MTYIKFQEHDVEDYLYQNPQTIRLDGENLQRQFNLNQYGVIDLMSYSSDEFGVYVHIVEIKAEPLSIKHLSQLCRYMSGIEELFWSKFHGEKVYVCGSLVTLPCELNGDDLFLLKQIKKSNLNIDFFEYKVTLSNGIEFFEQNHNWYNTGFYSKKTIRFFASAIKTKYKIIKNCLLEYAESLPELFKELNHHQRAKFLIDHPEIVPYQIREKFIKKFIITGNPRIKKQDKNEPF